MLDHESSLKQDPIYEIDDGKKLQVITRQSTDTIGSQILFANTQLFVDMDNTEVLAVRFTHDGFRVTSRDTVTTVWSFARYV